MLALTKQNATLAKEKTSKEKLWANEKMNLLSAGEALKKVMTNLNEEKQLVNSLATISIKCPPVVNHIPESPKKVISLMRAPVDKLGN